MPLPANLPARVVPYEGRYLPDTGPSSFGWHELSEFALCPQRWAYLYLLDLDAGRQEYFDRGRAFHAGLGAAYLRLWARQNGADENLFWDPMAAVHIVSQQEGRPDMEHPVSVAVATHIEHVVRAEEHLWRILGIELEVQVPVDGVTPGISRGVDLVRQSYASGLVQILDHKSRAGLIRRIEQSYENDLTLDFLWRWGSQTYGNLFEGVFLSYTTLPKAAARPVTIDMDLVKTKRSPWREAAIGDTVRYYRRQLQALLDSGLDPWHWPKLQVGFGPCRRCPFQTYCRFGPPRSAGGENG